MTPCGLRHGPSHLFSSLFPLPPCFSTSTFPSKFPTSIHKPFLISLSPPSLQRLIHLVLRLPRSSRLFYPGTSAAALSNLATREFWDRICHHGHMARNADGFQTSSFNHILWDTRGDKGGNRVRNNRQVGEVGGGDRGSLPLGKQARTQPLMVAGLHFSD